MEWGFYAHKTTSDPARNHSGRSTTAYFMHVGRIVAGATCKKPSQNDVGQRTATPTSTTAATARCTDAPFAPRTHSQPAGLEPHASGHVKHQDAPGAAPFWRGKAPTTDAATGYCLPVSPSPPPLRHLVLATVSTSRCRPRGSRLHLPLWSLPRPSACCFALALFVSCI